MKKATTLIFTFLLTQILFAQVNTEKLRKTAKDNGFSGNVETSLNLKDGNSEVLNLGFGFSVDFKKNKNLIFAVNDFELEKSGKSRVVNKGFSHLRYNYKVNDFLTNEFFTQVEYNEFTRLDLRNLYGLGVRMNFLKNKIVNLVFGTSYLFEIESLKDQDSKDKNHRSSNYFLTKISFERFALLNTVYFQPKVNDLQDFRILNESSLIFELTESLGFKSSFKLRHDNEPPVQVKKTDLEVKNSLIFEW